MFDETWFLLEAGRLWCNAVQLEAAIDSAKVGEYDGNEVAVDGSDGNLYMYGPDADRLFAVVRPVLEACGFMKGASVTLRYGPPADGVREVTVQLASWHLAGADA